MSSNENLNDVENNNSEKKKNNPIKNIGSKIGTGIEGFIVFLLICTVVVIVISTFFEEQLEQAGLEIDDEYEEEEDYDYREYHFSPDYSIGTSSNYIIENNGNVSVDDLTQSELFNEILKQTTKEELKNSISEENDTVSYVGDFEIEEDNYLTEYNKRKDFYKEEFEKAKEKLVIEDEGVTVNNELMICLDNQSPTILYDLDVYAVFYSNNEIVEAKREFIEAINSNSKYFLKFRYEIENYDRYEIVVTKEYYGAYNETLINDNIEFTSKKVNDSIKINYKNNGSEDIDAIGFSVVYYDENNKIVDIENRLSNYGREKEGTIEAYGNWDLTKNKAIEYDHYEVILDYAEGYYY